MRNKFKKSYVLLMTFLLPAILFGQGISTLKDAMPSVLDSNAIVVHNSYILEYSEPHEQARWVVYHITPSQLDKTIKRSNNFKVDTMVATGSANNDDYRKSGYDRGHLKPANVSKTSELDMKESFYYSNMSPQVPKFNRGIWKKLEAFVLKTAETSGSLWVVTGPVLEDGLLTIGENQVSVPRYYYKVLLDLEPPEYRAIAFIIPNEDSDKPLLKCALPVDKLESMLGIDFFPNLDDALENKLEAKVNIFSWDFPLENSDEDQALPKNVIFK
jgi:endonuclease G